MSPARQPSWRAMERRYKWLTADLARKAAESRKRDRDEVAAGVCPDGDACPDAGCIAARAAARRGAGWREVAALCQAQR
jgi:hypothetical protein